MGRVLASGANRKLSQFPGDGKWVAAPPAGSDSLLEFDITFYINVEPCYFPLLASFSVFTTLAGCLWYLFYCGWRWALSNSLVT